MGGGRRGVNHAGQHSWGPVDWSFWEFRTNVYQLSNTCSALLLGVSMFDISHGRTISARGWRSVSPPSATRRDIVKSELNAMATNHGFAVEKVEVADDESLLISLQVKGDTITEQTTEILSGFGGTRRRYHQTVRTEWGPLRQQVYGFLQTTLDAHDGYVVVRVTVVGKDGEQSLGELEAPRAEREAMFHGEEVESIRARLPVDTLSDESIPVILKGPIVPVA